jgi:hypothetical protein
MITTGIELTIFVLVVGEGSEPACSNALYLASTATSDESTSGG